VGDVVVLCNHTGVKADDLCLRCFLLCEHQGYHPVLDSMEHQSRAIQPESGDVEATSFRQWFQMAG
jgi:hypothetical protein